jgi:hypothetical protein
MVRDSNDGKFLEVLAQIEVGLKREYELNPELTDARSMLALDNAKIAIKQEHGFARNEVMKVQAGTQGIVDWCVGVGQACIGETDGPTLKEFVARLDKVKKSVEQHSATGRRGYYEFIKKYV